MSGPNISIKSQLKVSLSGLRKIFRLPQYILLSLAVTFVVMGAIVWLPNWRLLFDIGRLPISFFDKWKTIFEGYAGIFTNFDKFPAISIFIVALLLGITVSLITAIGINRANSARSAGAGAAAIFGAGCAACGTSILAPLVAAIGGATSVSFITYLGYTANLLAIILLTYSIFRLSQQAATFYKY